MNYLFFNRNTKVFRFWLPLKIIFGFFSSDSTDISRKLVSLSNYIDRLCYLTLLFSNIYNTNHQFLYMVVSFSIFPLILNIIGGNNYLYWIEFVLLWQKVIWLIKVSTKVRSRVLVLFIVLWNRFQNFW